MAAAALLPLTLGAAGCQPATGETKLERAPSGLEQVPLTVTTASGQSHRFIVEVARTSEEQANGLMNRQSLAPDRGMIFPYDPPRDASFWMRNTLIPLDIIYVRPDGSIARIVNAVPLDETPIPSLEPVGLVLEIAGGRAAELGIKPGDKVKW